MCLWGKDDGLFTTDPMGWIEWGIRAGDGEKITGIGDDHTTILTWIGMDLHSSYRTT